MYLLIEGIRSRKNYSGKLTLSNTTNLLGVVEITKLKLLYIECIFLKKFKNKQEIKNNCLENIWLMPKFHIHLIIYLLNNTYTFNDVMMYLFVPLLVFHIGDIFRNYS